RRAPAAGILALTFVHIVLGVVLACFSSDQPAVSLALFLGLIFAQTSLLGMWGGLGGNHWLLRMIGIVTGTIYLWMVCGLGIGDRGEYLFWPSVAILQSVYMVASLAVIRRLDYRLLQRSSVAQAQK
ncbi:MAG: hypothetical protein JJ992_21120, partial [Planctomycetes bacterium]|nr:hypothetical protein [Planctomycetota bacterium]